MAGMAVKPALQGILIVDFGTQMQRDAMQDQ